MSVRVRRNPRLERELAGQPQVEAALRQIAGDAAAKVRAATPAGDSRRRVQARQTRIHLDPWFWHLIEYGSANNPPYAPVRRGIRAAGLRLEDRGPR